ncbi:hypothetical protein [Corynebacterium sp. MSK195]|uniref:hypothetical protein n=1 Tax=Corynebacterium sp. MSK195 TaxID=3050216 RepID=UPI00255199B3|nr:hypothetical protein [Corynebacterium sp. MSK195]MDK8671520.1 hypothetical protein [Corynebacterium sp. MSK195]
MGRLARSLIDLHRLVDEFTERGVSVKFLKVRGYWLPSCSAISSGDSFSIWLSCRYPRPDSR